MLHCHFNPIGDLDRSHTKDRGVKSILNGCCPFLSNGGKAIGIPRIDPTVAPLQSVSKPVSTAIQTVFS